MRADPVQPTLFGAELDVPSKCNAVMVLASRPSPDTEVKALGRLCARRAGKISMAVLVFCWGKHPHLKKNFLSPAPNLGFEGLKNPPPQKKRMSKVRLDCDALSIQNFHGNSDLFLLTLTIFGSHKVLERRSTD
jgi:hypothetical protein